MKPPLSSSDGTCASAAVVEGENQADTSMEDCEVAELASPKKPSEVLMNGGGKFDNGCPSNRV